ncbi:C4-dicarboxylate TRAP transporter substrate-binding protein [Hoeflea prorocentri]|uniref:C4-dicarboxylate TRAP transporter substrate-binding protein n=1 Tax=Hoeflea prorocentri TaxID=1922333 RepID=A0A9X3UM35_9HYPH|nr:C4-dicarboxylate TRAP transporter substrate-binding protein [Hoeflea prorocentri]MCY6383747.1 C4-dicarboxylate TRAP transporter substrate-binding protein [Hoeflea prorocentri]MDA5401547.1 C4-dicarboxylate TRAP transporter substrate-binding protein [Hoeflea prorocentri]
MIKYQPKTAVLAAATLSCFVVTSNIAMAETREFNASNWLPESTALVKNGYIEWAEDLEKRSGGTLKANVFTGSVLLPPASHLTGIRDGVVDVGYHAGTYTPADLPLDNILAQVAISYSDNFVAALAITDLNINNADLQAEWASHNIVFGGGYATIPYRLFCTEPVTSLEDIAGKKMRMTGSVHSDWAKSVGAIPVNVPSSEMYSGLEKGQLDCASNTIEQLKTSSLWDVSKHTSMVELGIYYAGYHYGINRDFWSSLTSEQRRTMLDSFSLSIARTMIGYTAAGEAVAAEALEQGVTLHEPDADLAQSITDYKEIARQTALEVGKEKFGVDNAEELISAFEASISKWEELLADVDRTDEDALASLIQSEIYDKVDADKYGLK